MSADYSDEPSCTRRGTGWVDFSILEACENKKEKEKWATKNVVRVRNRLFLLVEQYTVTVVDGIYITAVIGIAEITLKRNGWANSEDWELRNTEENPISM